MPERWRGVSEKLWKEPNLHMVALALRELDPALAPGHDGLIGAFYKTFASPFSPALLDLIREVGETGVLPASWCEGMTRCVPKEQVCIAVSKQRPITLLTCKIKWLTGVLKLALNDLASFVVPRQQVGFIKGRRMDDHLSSVQKIWKSGRQGAWLSIDFAKAFDSTSHALLGFFLEFLGVPEARCAALIRFLKGPLHFLVGNQLTASALYPGTGIKQGDTLSPTIFSLLTAVLIRKVLHRFP